MVDGVPGRQPQLIAVDVLRVPAELDTAHRLVAIEQAVEEWIALYRPTSVAIERVFAQHNVQTVMGTAQAAGVAMLVAARHGIPVSLHTPSEVKASITGSGRAAKDQVGAMVSRILKLDEAPSGRRDRRTRTGHLSCLAWRHDRPADRGDGGRRRASQRPRTVFGRCVRPGRSPVRRAPVIAQSAATSFRLARPRR